MPQQNGDGGKRRHCQLLSSASIATIAATLNRVHEPQLSSAATLPSISKSHCRNDKLKPFWHLIPLWRHATTIDNAIST
ncbi:AAEL008762-PA [Aedes aegypti]|uniref:AAEL008762-PA n=1 Tax=Aedes aegypti TaxID=7159 RepID=Q16XV1_AEDAE|nr:AAEL008762-PA [Aedes aegypti]